MKILSQIEIKGFKSIKDLQILQLDRINVLIGANGAGKSNLISFFRMLSWMLGGTGNLQVHIQTHGGAGSFLFENPQVTTRIKAGLTFQTSAGVKEYLFELVHAARD
ncbi:MAG: AAA family ATPase, partial [bacterium]